MAMLSINLGLINLFPIPMLDGGHLVIFAIEAVRGQPLSLRAQELIFKVGLALIILLSVIVFYNDIMRLLSGWKLD
jgi:regulator of sigma E protease